eukprot:2663972-Prymnesium_polylepis.2
MVQQHTEGPPIGSVAVAVNAFDSFGRQVLGRATESVCAIRLLEELAVHKIRDKDVALVVNEKHARCRASQQQTVCVQHSECLGDARSAPLARHLVGGRSKMKRLHQLLETANNCALED